MIIRIETEYGIKRITMDAHETFSDLYSKVASTFGPKEKEWKLYYNRKKVGYLPHSPDECGSLKNGQLFFMYPAVGTRFSKTEDTVTEDPIDVALWNSESRIYLGGSKLCQHSTNSRCINCNFVESYDEAYLTKINPPIKFLPFHSYMRKMINQSNGTPLVLDQPNCRVDRNCAYHKPYPAGICSRCQPGALTLIRQPYRHVEFVSFENDIMVQRFLEFWRMTGKQRVGYLFGRYEAMKDVVLGIMAVVVAIYEPPQVSEFDQVSLKEDSDSRVKWLASQLGLVPVGWIFTDLVVKDSKKGTVKHFRGNTNSYYLSSQECIMAAHMQNRYPNSCRFAKGGYYGSKFVTVVATGDTNNQIHLEAYQTSVQCMSLVKEKLLLPTIGCSQLTYVKDSTDEEYVPDVFYAKTDQYGNTVNQIARPVPNEFLLTELEVGTPKIKVYSLPIDPEKRFFAIENRSEYLETQNLLSFAKYWQQFDGDFFLECIGDLHVLLFLASPEFGSLGNCFDDLLRAVRERDRSLLDRIRHGIDMQSLIELVRAAIDSAPPDGSKVCSRCTFINTVESTRCEVCEFNLS